MRSSLRCPDKRSRRRASRPSIAAEVGDINRTSERAARAAWVTQGASANQSPSISADAPSNGWLSCSLQTRRSVANRGDCRVVDEACAHGGRPLLERRGDHAGVSYPILWVQRATDASLCVDQFGARALSSRRSRLCAGNPCSRARVARSASSVRPSSVSASSRPPVRWNPAWEECSSDS